MNTPEINKCYKVDFYRGPLQNPVSIKVKEIYRDLDNWSLLERYVDYIDAEAIDSNGIYYESIK